jgi:hypothetical protein
MAYSNQLNAVIKIIGPQAAIRMSRQYGGRPYRVPKVENLHDMHPLVVVIGLADAEKLSRAFAEQSIKFPDEINTLSQVRDTHVMERVAAGESFSSIATALHLDRKMIQKIFARYVAMGKVAGVEMQSDLL